MADKDKQDKITDANQQVYYDGRWIPKDHFRVFVYNGQGQKLANSYAEYESLIASGLWFSCKADIAPKEPVNIKSGASRKPKHASTNG